VTLFLKKNRVTTSLDVAATCQCHVTICLRDILPMSHLHLHDIPPHVTDTGHKACFMPGQQQPQAVVPSLATDRPRVAGIKRGGRVW
jgi:hypothetical protein